MAVPDEVRNLEFVEAKIIAAKRLMSSGSIANAQVLLTEAVDQVRVVSSSLLEGEVTLISDESETAMKKLVDLFYTRFENP